MLNFQSSILNPSGTALSIEYQFIGYWLLRSASQVLWIFLDGRTADKSESKLPHYLTPLLFNAVLEECAPAWCSHFSSPTTPVQTKRGRISPAPVSKTWTTSSWSCSIEGCRCTHSRGVNWERTGCPGYLRIGAINRA